MIKLESPSFCFSSCDVGLSYKMWKNRVGRKGMTPGQLAGAIVSASLVALKTWSKGLQNIILNCHGYPGGLWVGGLWDVDDNPSTFALTNGNVAAFGMLKPWNLGTIWIVSCDVAKGDRGQAFCQALAKTAGTQVIASDTDQEITTSQGLQLGLLWMQCFQDYIDDYEGTVYSFTPVGVVRKGIDPEQEVWTAKGSRW